MASRTTGAPREPRAFIAWENRRRGRYELVGGEVRAMAGGSRAHDLIAGNVAFALRTALRGGRCDVHGSDLKVVSPTGMVTYPDVFVRCGALADTATECGDPIVVIELTSRSTSSYDHVFKRWCYQAIATLRHLVCIDWTLMKVEVATRTEGGWHSVFQERPDDVVRLDAVGAAPPLAEIDAGTAAASCG
jgi:Uma2 family endonuclease